MIHPDFSDLSLFQEKNIIGFGPYSKTSLIVNKQTKQFFAKRAFIDIDQKALTKFQKSYSELYGIRYPCSILPYIVEPCLYTPYFKNQSLKNLIQKIEKRNIINKFDNTQKLIIIYGILYFLDSIHRNYKMHGRLMASNVLLDSNFNPYISDYYLCQLNTIGLFTESNCKMIDYIISMPPEILTSDSTNTYCQKSDIYSFGIILLQILTQRINVYSDISDNSETIKTLKIIGVKPLMEKTNKSKLENYLYDIINRCLEPKPNDRPTAHDIMIIINSIIQNEQEYDKQRFQQFLSSLKKNANDDKNGIDNYYPKDDPFFKQENPDIKNKKGFILTDGEIKILKRIYYYLECGVPVILEGPTKTSITLSKIVCQLRKQKLIIFNLSSDYQKSWAGISMSTGPFVEAFKNGYTLLLNKLDLASQECLQFIEEALDSSVISLENPGMPLEEIVMHKDFRLIATYNPNKRYFSNRRLNLGIKFLSRFQNIILPSNDGKCKVLDSLDEDPSTVAERLIEGKPIILKDISNFPTVVLERFNELFSSRHNLTLNEDIHDTFTSSENKELDNFSSTFRVFATCQENAVSKLSEAVSSVINASSDEINDLDFAGLFE